jgi:hypothetical protein
MTSLLSPAALLGFNVWVATFECYWFETNGPASVALASAVFATLFGIEYVALSIYFRWRHIAR